MKLHMPVQMSVLKSILPSQNKILQNKISSLKYFIALPRFIM